VTAANPASILDSIKKVLGFDPDFTDFDLDIIMHINAFFGTLQQLGAGPTEGFVISDNTKLWSDFSDNQMMRANVQSWMYLKVRMTFDPPATSFVIDSQTKMADEILWRISILSEQINPPSDPFGSSTKTATSKPAWWNLTGLSDFPIGAVVGDWGYDLNSGDVYTNGQTSNVPVFWDLTGLSDFPTGAISADLGIDTATGDIWSYSA
jgi:hypothetical protein